MKWVGISGGRRRTNKEVEKTVRKTVREIFRNGDGIATGGALGVDFIALKEALVQDPNAERIKIFLPSSLDKYIAQHQKHMKLGNIDSKETKELIKTLNQIKGINPGAIIENLEASFTEENKLKLYYDRNTEVVKVADELIAFPIKTEMSDSLGTMDTIGKAKKKGIPVRTYSFNLKNNK